MGHSLLVVGVATREVVVADVAQDHGLDALEVVEAVASCVAERVDERWLRIVAQQAAKLAQAGNAPSSRCAPVQLGDPGGELGELGVQLALLGDELLVAALPVLGALRLGEPHSLRAIHPARMGGNHARPIEQLDLGLGLAHLELVTDVASGHFVAKRVDVDVALEVDEAGVDAIDG
ncbi:MAG: hypothetical protein IPI67_24530 [Myxococcales bacterium]|nr:hypothetical protein [Myxococcales bacterium]